MRMTPFLIRTKFCSCFLVFFLVATPSSYVLPYPSFMPGHKFYRVEEIFDRLYGFWCFGNLARFKCDSKMADKKLIEARILFEYGQLSWGIGAIQKYRLYLSRTFLALEMASGEGKNVSQKKEIFIAALDKHQEVLGEILGKTPETFYWQEEKEEGKTLTIKQTLDLAQVDIVSFYQKLQKL